MGRLMKIPEAAEDLGVPISALETAAEEHGYLIRMGRAKRIDPEDLPELVKKCRVPRKVPASTAARTADNGSSSTARHSVGQARRTADKLKRRSQPISPPETSQVVPLARKE